MSFLSSVSREGREISVKSLNGPSDRTIRLFFFFFMEWDTQYLESIEELRTHGSSVGLV